MIEFENITQNALFLKCYRNFHFLKRKIHLFGLLYLWLHKILTTMKSAAEEGQDQSKQTFHHHFFMIIINTKRT